MSWSINVPRGAWLQAGSEERSCTLASMDRLAAESWGAEDFSARTAEEAKAMRDQFDAALVAARGLVFSGKIAPATGHFTLTLSGHADLEGPYSSVTVSVSQAPAPEPVASTETAEPDPF